jgi:hypothetical protein
MNGNYGTLQHGVKTHECFKINLILALLLLLYRVLRRICGPKRDEVTGGWRKLHNEELHNLYSSPSIIRMNDEMGGSCSTNGGEEECI